MFNIPRDELHGSLGGGFPKGSIILIEGKDALGKSVLCQRFLFGFLHNAHTVTLISTELTYKEFLDQMYSLGYNIATPLLRGDLLYMPVYPLIKKIKPSMDYIKLLMNAERLFESDITIIDTLSLMLRYTKISKEEMVELVSFFKRLSALKKTIICTVNPELVNEEILNPIKETAHIYLTLDITMIGTYVSRQIKVKRFAQTESPVEDIIGFRVEPTIGVIVEIMTFA